jgi:hypothetical protein
MRNGVDGGGRNFAAHAKAWGALTCWKARLDSCSLIPNRLKGACAEPDGGNRALARQEREGWVRGRHPRVHWTRVTDRHVRSRGIGDAGLQPENLGWFRSGASEASWTFLCRNQRWAARSLGDRARRTLSALHHQGAGTFVPVTTPCCKHASKLKKIKYLQRKRGAIHYRGQKRPRDHAVLWFAVPVACCRHSERISRRGR